VDSRRPVNFLLLGLLRRVPAVGSVLTHSKSSSWGPPSDPRMRQSLRPPTLGPSQYPAKASPSETSFGRKLVCMLRIRNCVLTPTRPSPHSPRNSRQQPIASSSKNGEIHLIPIEALASPSRRRTLHDDEATCSRCPIGQRRRFARVLSRVRSRQSKKSRRQFETSNTSKPKRCDGTTSEAKKKRHRSLAPPPNTDDELNVGPVRPYDAKT